MLPCDPSAWRPTPVERPTVSLRSAPSLCIILDTNFSCRCCYFPSDWHSCDHPHCPRGNGAIFATLQHSHTRSFSTIGRRLTESLEDENKRSQDQITAARGQVGIAQTSAKTALDEADARRKETDLLRGQKSAVEKQANQFKLNQAELNDRIRELERILETATKNNADLRDRAARFSALLRQTHLPTSTIAQLLEQERQRRSISEAAYLNSWDLNIYDEIIRYQDFDDAKHGELDRAIDYVHIQDMVSKLDAILKLLFDHFMRTQSNLQSAEAGQGKAAVDVDGHSTWRVDSGLGILEEWAASFSRSATVLARNYYV